MESQAKKSEREGQEEALQDEPEYNPPVKEELSAIEQQYAALPNVGKRIHILGTGSIGKLVAHSLRGIPNPPPITLILHRRALRDTWAKSKKVITLQDGDFVIERGGFDVELPHGPSRPWRQYGIEVGKEGSVDVYQVAEQTGLKPHEVASMVQEEQKKYTKSGEEEQDKYTESEEETDYRPLASSEEPIHNLLVMTKTTATIAALSAVRHRLSRESTICFMQNGMGVIDDVNKEIFPDEETRPDYVQGIVSHGANVPPEKAEQDPFFVVHAGHGTISLGALPRIPLANRQERPPTPTGHGTDNSGEEQPGKVEQWSPSARYILRTLTRCPVLAAVGFTPIELLQLQLEKLAVNSIMNPLTSLLDARNGNLLYNFALTRTMRMMLAETSLVIRSLPELQGIPNIPNRFSAERLEILVVNVAKKTANNISSMLADVRAGRRTEIEYINGYIIKRGEELGIKCVVNYAIMQTVLGKARMIDREDQDDVPLAGLNSD